MNAHLADTNTIVVCSRGRLASVLSLHGRVCERHFLGASESPSVLEGIENRSSTARVSAPTRAAVAARVSSARSIVARSSWTRASPDAPVEIRGATNWSADGDWPQANPPVVATTL